MHADRFAPLPAEKAAIWQKFGAWDQIYFPTLIGLQVEELRIDYARMRLPFRDELNQPAGVVHGGAIATLIETVVVPAVGSAYDVFMNMLTIDLQIRFLGAAVGTDLVAEGWVNRRGRSILFCQAEVRAVDTGDVVAEGWLTYKVSAPRTGAPTNGAT